MFHDTSLIVNVANCVDIHVQFYLTSVGSTDFWKWMGVGKLWLSLNIINYRVRSLVRTRKWTVPVSWYGPDQLFTIEQCNGMCYRFNGRFIQPTCPPSYDPHSHCDTRPIIINSARISALICMIIPAYMISHDCVMIILDMIDYDRDWCNNLIEYIMPFCNMHVNLWYHSQVCWHLVGYGWTPIPYSYNLCL